MLLASGGAGGLRGRSARSRSWGSVVPIGGGSTGFRIRLGKCVVRVHDGIVAALCAGGGGAPLRRCRWWSLSTAAHSRRPLRVAFRGARSPASPFSSLSYVPPRRRASGVAVTVAWRLCSFRLDGHHLHGRLSVRCSHSLGRPRRRLRLSPARPCRNSIRME